jgi:hypothetical protein
MHFGLEPSSLSELFSKLLARILVHRLPVLQISRSCSFPLFPDPEDDVLDVELEVFEARDANEVLEALDKLKARTGSGTFANRTLFCFFFIVVSNIAALSPRNSKVLFNPAGKLDTITAEGVSSSLIDSTSNHTSDSGSEKRSKWVRPKLKKTGDEYLTLGIACSESREKCAVCCMWLLQAFPRTV